MAGGLPAEAGVSTPPSAVEIDAHGLPEDPGARPNYLSPFTPPDMQPPKSGGLLHFRRWSSALSRYVFGDPPPSDPTPEEAEAMRKADEAKIAEIREVIAALPRRSNPGRTPGIDELTGYGLGGEREE